MPTVAHHDRGSFTFTVGKLDAGMAILIGSRAHLIEFPSILLPDGVSVGSIVNINVQRNVTEEDQQKASFWKLQNDIYMMYGIKTPITPTLKLRNVTQTSVTLEWPSLQLATASLRSLDLYRSGQRLATIPNPTGNTSTKVSGLQMASPYTFQLILRTSAGTYPSNVIEVKTHTIEDTSGISVCFGTILDSDVGDGESAAGRKEELQNALISMGAKYSETIQIDTTHFVCTTSLSLSSISKGGAPKTAAVAEEPGVEYQKAVQLSIPIVQPDWILACYYGKKMVPTAPYYLGSSVPPLLQGHNRVQSISRQNQPLPPSSPPSMSAAATPQAKRPAASASNSRSSISGTTSNRASTSTPPVGNKTKGKEAFILHETGDESVPNSASPTVPARSSTTSNKPMPIPEPSLPSVDGEAEEEEPTTPSEKNRGRTGTMNKAFRFPPEGGGGKNNGNLTISPPPPLPFVPPTIVVHAAQDSIVEPPKPAPTPSTARMKPEPPTPDAANAPSVSMNRRDSETDGGEIVEIDLS